MQLACLSTVLSASEQQKLYDGGPVAASRLPHTHTCNILLYYYIQLATGPELGIAHLHTFLVRNCQHFWCVQVSALFCNFGCASSKIGAEVIVMQPGVQVAFFGVHTQLRI